MSQKFEGDIHPEEKSLLGFQILLTWLNPLIQLSNQRPLVDNDVWNPPTRDRVNQTAAVFWDEWEKEIDACEGWNDESIEPEKRKRSPSLLRVLFRTFGWKLALSGCVQIVFFLFQIGQPF